MLDKTDTRAVRHAGTRDRILKAAWRLARRQGLAGISLREIADAVGMRAPSLYSYFDSKLALYDAMFAQGMEQFAAALDEAPGETTNGDAAALLRSRAHVVVRFGAEDPVRYQLLFQRTIPGFEPSAESYAISQRVYEDAHAAFRAAGLDDRALDLYTSIITGLVSQQLANDPGGSRYERLTDEAIDMFLSHFNVQKTKRRRK